jgi:DNA-binding MarR family transcriptional regulator
MTDKKDVVRIGRITATLDGVYWKISKLAGVKENLFWLLYVLDDGEFHTQKQISDDWMFPKTTINTLIKECEEDGYIRLEAVQGRKRDLKICLTEKGHEYAKEVLQPIYQIENKALESTLSNAPSFLADLELFTNELYSALERYKENGKK